MWRERIEPSSSDFQSDVLPLNYPHFYKNIIEPYGIWTHLSAVKGQRPDQIDERSFLIQREGFEPSFLVSKTNVLPIRRSLYFFYNNSIYKKKFYFNLYKI